MTAPPPAEAAPLPDVLPATPRGPVRERSLLPDVLRGVALAGILIVNMQDFAGFREWTQTGADRVAQVLTDTLANGRFISIFAMLFGWGAAGLFARHGGRLYALRHLVLFAVGTLHFVFVWHGDIIATYASLALVFGAVLLMTREMGQRAAVSLYILIAVVLGGGWLGYTLLQALASVGYTGGRFTGFPSLPPGLPYPSVVAERAADYTPSLIGGALYNGPWLIALFCLGAAAARTGVLSRPEDHRPLWRRLALFGLPGGIALGLLLAVLNTRPEFWAGLLAIPVRMSGGLAGALGYAGVLGLLASRGRLGPWRHFAASGRLAMSNYLTQSLVMTTVFYPYAGAQWGRWGALPCLLLALTVGLAQLPLSAWWLRRRTMGPVEGVVRALVYGSEARGRD